METCKSKVAQASEEITHLKELLAQKEAKIQELKNKQAGCKDALAELNQLVAAKEQTREHSKVR